MSTSESLKILQNFLLLQKEKGKNFDLELVDFITSLDRLILTVGAQVDHRQRSLVRWVQAVQALQARVGFRYHLSYIEDL
jgi:hypothetical protein